MPRNRILMRTFRRWGYRFVCRSSVRWEPSIPVGATIRTVPLVVLCAVGCGAPDPEQVEGRQQREVAAITVVLCENAVKETLRSPGTADFPFGHVMNVTHSGGRHRLISHVDSQNALGGVVRTRFSCVTEGRGGDVDDYRVVALDVVN